MKTKKRIGFTLVEVVIVLAIIAIIAAIAIPNFMKIKYETIKKSDIQNCEGIKRTINTLIVDEIILYNNSNKGKIVIDCIDTQNGLPTIKVSNIIGNSASDIEKMLQQYLKGVKAPQQDKGGGYTVIIDTEGEIEYIEANEHAPGTGVVGTVITNTFIGTIAP